MRPDVSTLFNSAGGNKSGLGNTLWNLMSSKFGRSAAAKTADETGSTAADSVEISSGMRLRTAASRKAAAAAKTETASDPETVTVTRDAKGKLVVSKDAAAAASSSPFGSFDLAAKVSSQVGRLSEAALKAMAKDGVATMRVNGKDVRVQLDLDTPTARKTDSHSLALERQADDVADHFHLDEKGREITKGLAPVLDWFGVSVKDLEGDLTSVRSQLQAAAKQMEEGGDLFRASSAQRQLSAAFKQLRAFEASRDAALAPEKETVAAQVDEIAAALNLDEKGKENIRQLADDLALFGEDISSLSGDSKELLDRMNTTLQRRTDEISASFLASEKTGADLSIQAMSTAYRRVSVGLTGQPTAALSGIPLTLLNTRTLSPISFSTNTPQWMGGSGLTSDFGSVGGGSTSREIGLRILQAMGLAPIPKTTAANLASAAGASAAATTANSVTSSAAASASTSATTTTTTTNADGTTTTTSTSVSAEVNVKATSTVTVSAAGGTVEIDAAIAARFALGIDLSFYDPLVLDLAGDGLNLRSAEDGVDFDFAGDGVMRHGGFIQGDDALLFLDQNGNGVVDSALELFGDQEGDAHGFAKLARYDSNGDGVIDENDEIYDQLRLWQDKNGDGICDADETMSLREAGIRSLDLAFLSGRTEDKSGNLIGETGGFTREDGSRGMMADVWFRAGVAPEQIHAGAKVERAE